MKVCDRITPRFPGRNPIEILVVAFDPVQRRQRFGIRACPARHVAHAQPERHVWMPFDRAAHRVEVAVDVGEGAYRQGPGKRCTASRSTTEDQEPEARSID